MGFNSVAMHHVWVGGELTGNNNGNAVTHPYCSACMHAGSSLAVYRAADQGHDPAAASVFSRRHMLAPKN